MRGGRNTITPLRLTGSVLPPRYEDVLRQAAELTLHTGVPKRHAQGAEAMEDLRAID